MAELRAELMLDPVELEILSTLNSEQTLMRAGEISALIDETYQLVGRRTSKLKEMGLVEKERDAVDAKMRSKITERAESTYFPTQAHE